MASYRAAAAVGLAVLAGCSSATDGAGGPVDGPAGPSSGAEVVPELPPRPAALSVDGVDACTLVPEADRAGLEIDRPPTTGDPTDTGGRPEDSQCGFSVSEWGIYAVTASPQYTAMQYLTEVRGEPTVVDVAGYPAVRSPSPDNTGACFVALDVSDTSSLTVGVWDRRSMTPESQQVVCDRVETLGVVVLAALAAQQ